jgi:signal transduction histidine kinase
MPEMDGYELLTTLKNNPATSGIPIILLTAKTDDQGKAQALHHGAEDYLVKPFSSRELLIHAEARVQIARARKETQQALLGANSKLEEKVAECTTELRAYNEMLKTKNSRLKVLNEELSGLTFAASHDMREPLRKLRFFTQRLLKEEEPNLSPQGKIAFQRVLSFVQNMNDLVSDIALYSFYERAVDRLLPIDLELLLQNLTEFLKAVLAEKNATININVMPGLRGDEEQVKQVIYNLISNSLKFARTEQPLHITISGKLISGEFIDDERADKGRTYYAIEVRDNGIGFDQQYQNQIYQLFRKLHGRSIYPGTGVGLTIVRKIMDNHNGFVIGRSTLGLGASFHCYFPG